MAVTLLLLALAYAALAHGAFHAAGLAVVVVIVVLALASAFAARRPERADLRAPALAAAALAAWYVCAAAIAGHLSGAGPAVGLLFSLVGCVLVARRADDAERELLLVGLLVLGALVAWSGWLGVAFHHRPLAIEDNGLWRAASTITYANATGAFTGALALVALDRMAIGPLQQANAASMRATALVAMSCLTGLAATASRGAVSAFVIGLVVLVSWRRRAALRVIVAPMAGAVVAVAALLASMRGGGHAHPVVAVVGAAVGAGVAVLPGRYALRAAAVCVVAGALVPGLRSDVRAAWRPIASQRLTTSSVDRTQERRAALDVTRAHPITGVGPGNVTLRWSVYYFVPVAFTERYAHDEYLQVVLESGVVGLAIVVVGTAAVLVALGRASGRAPRSAPVAGVAAALAMLAVHSATDFLWHVPLVPLAASVLVGSVLSVGATSCGDPAH